MHPLFPVGENEQGQLPHLPSRNGTSFHLATRTLGSLWPCRQAAPCVACVISARLCKGYAEVLAAASYALTCLGLQTNPVTIEACSHRLCIQCLRVASERHSACPVCLEPQVSTLDIPTEPTVLCRQVSSRSRSATRSLHSLCVVCRSSTRPSSKPSKR